MTHEEKRRLAMGNRCGVPTCPNPDDSSKIYMRNMYHEFFWGPFSDEEEVSQAIAKLDKADDMWDYDPFCMIYGASQLPQDFVNGFQSVPQEMRDRIESKRVKRSFWKPE
jgi:hypothetical protein